MIRRYPPLYRDVAEESLRSIIFAAQFVGPHRAAGLGVVLDHVERGGVLGSAVGLCQPCINDEIVPERSGR
jgi:hypothetical protein